MTMRDILTARFVTPFGSAIDSAREMREGALAGGASQGRDSGDDDNTCGDRPTTGAMDSEEGEKTRIWNSRKPSRFCAAWPLVNIRRLKSGFVRTLFSRSRGLSALSIARLKNWKSQERTELERRRIEERRRKKEEKRQNPSWPRHAGKPWDAEGDARLVTLWEQGATVNQIADEMERRSGGIASRLVRLGKVLDRDTARARGTGSPEAVDIPAGENAE